MTSSALPKERITSMKQEYRWQLICLRCQKRSEAMSGKHSLPRLDCCLMEMKVLAVEVMKTAQSTAD
jgi:hypothetical protein